MTKVQNALKTNDTFQKALQIWLQEMLLCFEQTASVNQSIQPVPSSNDAIGDAFRSIKFGFQDVMLVGDQESSINSLPLLDSSFRQPYQLQKIQLVLLFHLTKTVTVLS